MPTALGQFSGRYLHDAVGIGAYVCIKIIVAGSGLRKFDGARGLACRQRKLKHNSLAGLVKIDIKVLWQSSSILLALKAFLIIHVARLVVFLLQSRVLVTGAH